MLIILSWIWSAGCAFAALVMLLRGHPIVAVPFAASAVLAAPPSWPLFALWGVKASRPIKVALIIATYAIGSVLMAKYAPPPATAPQPAAGSVSTKTVASDPAATTDPAECSNGQAKPVDFAVQSSAPLRTHGSEQADQIAIPMGIDKVSTPVAVDPTMPVRQLCKSKTWSKIRILQLPSDIGKAEGWVPTSALRPVKTVSDGRRIYEASDFEWPEGSQRYQKAYLTVINRVMKQNSKCDAFGPQSLLMSKDRAGALLTASCFGAEEQTIEFRPEDATNGRSFVPVEPVRLISEKDAFAICEQAIKQSATHPSTLAISRWDAFFEPFTNGTSNAYIKFSAKNSFNLELKYKAHCSFNGSTFLNVEIGEIAE